MKNRALKTLVSIPCVIVAGVVDIIGTVFEMIYQIVRLIRRLFKLFSNAVCKSIAPLYDDKVDYGIKKVNEENEVESKDYEIFEID